MLVVRVREGEIDKKRDKERVESYHGRTAINHARTVGFIQLDATSEGIFSMAVVRSSPDDHVLVCSKGASCHPAPIPAIDHPYPCATNQLTAHIFNSMDFTTKHDY